MMMYKQSGSVLIFSLVMLFILSMVGVASMDNVTLNERMASNYRDHDVVFQAAEAALIEGERAALAYSASFDISDFQAGCASTSCFTATCSDGRCFSGTYLSTFTCDITLPPPTDLWLVENTWALAGRARELTANFPTLAVKPKYIVEFLCFVQANPLGAAPVLAVGSIGDVEWALMYQITAFAEGATGGSRAMVQSTFKVIQN